MLKEFFCKLRPVIPGLVVVLIMLQMIFLWHIDVSTGAIWRSNHLTNGFMDFDPLIIYHICLYGTIAITILFAIIIISRFYRVTVKA